MMAEGLERIREELGFLPPALKVAEELGDDYLKVISDYYQIIYRDEVIPLKYKALLGIATGIMAEHRAKVMLDIRKAFMFGATREEIIEVLRMMVWWCGAPTLAGMLPELLPKIDQYEEEFAGKGHCDDRSE